MRVGAGPDAATGGLGGPGAMGTTVLFAGTRKVVELVGVLPLADAAVDGGDSDSGIEFLPEFGVVAGVCATEFFLLAAFFDRLGGPGMGMDPPPPPRFRFLITSVLRLRGRTTPWSFRNRPHALHNG